MTSEKTINAPHTGRPDQGLGLWVPDPRGKGKRRFSLSVAQKVPDRTFCDPVNHCGKNTWKENTKSRRREQGGNRCFFLREGLGQLFFTATALL